MPRLHDLTRPQREKLLEDVLSLFVLFCDQAFAVTLYAYQLRVARALLSSILVDPVHVFVKICRQAGKTEVLTLLFKFLIIFFVHFVGYPLKAAIASPKGEQAKTDIDRIKQSILLLREKWGIEDHENNASTIRAYRKGVLCCEMYKFSLMPTTSLESKTLNVLAVEESHKADHRKISDECDPMLSSTNGVKWHFGVGGTVRSEYLDGCNGLLPRSVAIVVPVDEVIADRRAVYERTGNPSHLAYEKAFTAEQDKKGKNNPEIRRNYYLEDQVEAGNFISRERFVSCGRVGENWNRKNGLVIPCDDLVLSIDWGRKGDWTWAGLMNRQFDLIDMWKIDRMRYEQQIEMILSELKATRPLWNLKPDGTAEGVEGDYFSRITTVRGDSTGIGDFPNEYLQDHSGLPMGEESLVKFTPESKNEMYSLFDAALFREAGDPLRFSYPADHLLAGELEEQMTILLRVYKTDRELLSPHAPEEPGAHDDAPTMSALCCLGAATGKVGDILFL